MTTALNIQGTDGSLTAYRVDDTISIAAESEDELFRLTVEISPNDARALAAYLQQVSYIAFDTAEFDDVGEDEDYA